MIRREPWFPMARGRNYLDIDRMRETAVLPPELGFGRDVTKTPTINFPRENADGRVDGNVTDRDGG